MPKLTPKIKTIGTTIIFLLAGISSLLFFTKNIYTALPLFIFYITITINTYFSIRLFSSIVPHDNTKQNIIDALLFCLYIALAFDFNNPNIFVFLLCILFAIAIIKYTHLLGVITHIKLLKKKIIIDTLGALMALLSFFGIMYGSQTLSVWLLAIVFLLANIILLVVKPMYKIID